MAGERDAKSGKNDNVDGSSVEKDGSRKKKEEAERKRTRGRVRKEEEEEKEKKEVESLKNFLKTGKIKNVEDGIEKGKELERTPVKKVLGKEGDKEESQAGDDRRSNEVTDSNEEQRANNEQSRQQGAANEKKREEDVGAEADIGVGSEKKDTGDGNERVRE